jgi:hypothetical protein
LAKLEKSEMMDFLTVVVVLGILGYLFKVFMLDPEKIIKAYELEKSLNKKTEEEDPKNSVDFFGIKKAKEEPDIFLKDVEELKRKLQRGEKIKVNAGEALYMMRNAKYHNLIIGEDGTINFKQIEKDASDIDVISADDIFEKRMIKNKNKIADESQNSLPYYVEKIEAITDGGCRWIYHDWHSQACGISSVCFDKYGRSIPDPEKAIEPQKNSPRQNQTSQNKNNGSQDSLIVEIAKQVSKVKDMVQEDRVDRMLNNSSIKSESKSLDNNIEEVFIDDVEQLEKEFVIPDFKKTVQAKKEQSVIEFFDDKENITDDELEEVKETITTEEVEESSDSELAEEVEEYNDDDQDEKEGLEEEIDVYEMAYEDYATFISFEAAQEKFVEHVLGAVLSEGGIGSVYVDYASKKLIIEKNYFGKTISSLMLADHQKMFERDFEPPKMDRIFDGNKIDELLDSMASVCNIFDTHGKAKNKRVFNLLIEFLDINELYLSAWFIRISFDAHTACNEFLNAGFRLQEVQVISDEKREIDKRVRLLGDKCKRIA